MVPAFLRCANRETPLSAHIAYLDGPRLRRSLVAACEYTRQQRQELNRINVFPVPDGDTGTNLGLTVEAIADRLRRNRDRAVSAVADDAAEAALLGARGNSGMMLSHFLLGFAAHLKGRERVDPRGFAEALGGGIDNLYNALDNPVEGTILTVIRDTANAAKESSATDFVLCVDRLVDAARESLERTPSLLPVLKAAGVVDAGGRGFVHMLEGVLLLINGDPIVASGDETDYAQVPATVAEVEYPENEEQYRYCTEALVRGEGLPASVIVREELRRHGDSIIVVSSDTLLKVHVHTDGPDGVFSYLRTLGRLATKKAEDMRAQHAAARHGGGGHQTLVRRPFAIVTDSGNDLPEDIIRAHGIHVVPVVLVDGGRPLRDGIDITAEEFHEKMRDASGELPTTSQPPPQAFVDGFMRAAEDGDQILGVVLGSGVSGTFGSAEAAARTFDEAPVHLFDSCGVSILEGLLVLKAAELAESGTSAGEILAELSRVRDQSGIFATVDTFDRLLHSGRVGKGQAWFGGMLGVKPILSLTEEGKVGPVGKVIGRKKVLPAVLGLLEDRIPAGAKKLRFGVVHVGCPEIVEQVSAALHARYGDVDILGGPTAPIFATHLGLGAWCLAYMVED